MGESKTGLRARVGPEWSAPCALPIARFRLIENYRNNYIFFLFSLKTKPILMFLNMKSLQFRNKLNFGSWKEYLSLQKHRRHPPPPPDRDELSCNFSPKMANNEFQERVLLRVLLFTEKCFPLAFILWDDRPRILLKYVEQKKSQPFCPSTFVSKK